MAVRLPCTARYVRVRCLHAVLQSVGPDSDAFWAEMASQLAWDAPFTKVRGGSFKHGDIHWFEGGKLNISVNCLDRHQATKAAQTAIIFEDDERGVRHISYAEVLQEVCRLANLLKHWGVRKGDTVAIYLPMIPEIGLRGAARRPFLLNGL